MPRIHFHQQLEELKDKLLAMAALSQQAVEYAIDAYQERDEKLCTFVRENEAAGVWGVAPHRDRRLVTSRRGIRT